jgi:hypothetical protein
MLGICYILCMCVWARQIQKPCLMIPTSLSLCVMCVRRFLGGSQGGQVWPPLVTTMPQFFFWGESFAIFSGFLKTISD